MQQGRPSLPSVGPPARSQNTAGVGPDADSTGAPPAGLCLISSRVRINHRNVAVLAALQVAPPVYPERQPAHEEYEKEW